MGDQETFQGLQDFFVPKKRKQDKSLKGIKIITQGLSCAAIFCGFSTCEQKC